ncbi:hypothetical protein F383_11121 [Gossypium arboreum]|uniref:Uncharacterized protein n=1 Tax=Gossypium arboreum TaxID=29729 RepID=A0A0B0PWB2_GOSAR|nr:hypothetical protein F383_11121 [Gossypium arboreum]
MSSSSNILISISHVNPVEYLGNLDGLSIYRQVIRVIFSSTHSREPYILWQGYQSKLNPP